MEQRPGFYMRTYSGIKFYPMDPRSDEVNIQDIAHALSQQCRFGGHTQRFYSVAEHSVLCSFQGPPEHAFALLMHDAAEAYIGDMIRPLKVLPQLRAPYTEIEHKVEAVLAAKFGFEFPFHPRIKEVDMALCEAEQRQVMHGAEADSPDMMQGIVAPANVLLHNWTPEEAKSAFLTRFRHLFSARSTAKLIDDIRAERDGAEITL